MLIMYLILCFLLYIQYSLLVLLNSVYRGVPHSICNHVSSGRPAALFFRAVPWAILVRRPDHRMEGAAHSNRWETDISLTCEWRRYGILTRTYVKKNCVTSFRQNVLFCSFELLFHSLEIIVSFSKYNQSLIRVWSHFVLKAVRALKGFASTPVRTCGFALTEQDNRSLN